MAEYLNFAAKIHRMPEYPWQCLNFLGTGQASPEQDTVLPNPLPAATLSQYDPFCPF